GRPLEQLAGLEARQLPGLDEVLGHRLGRVAPGLREGAEGVLQLLAVEQPAADGGAEQALDGRAFGARRSRWLHGPDPAGDGGRRAPPDAPPDCKRPGGRGPAGAPPAASGRLSRCVAPSLWYILPMLRRTFLRCA